MLEWGSGSSTKWFSQVHAEAAASLLSWIDGSRV